jgi:hypothetical protein
LADGIKAPKEGRKVRHEGTINKEIGWGVSHRFFFFAGGKVHFRLFRDTLP